MHSLLSRLLSKRKVQHDDLSPEEKQTFTNWQKTLTGDPITVEKIVEFCENKVKQIKGIWRDDQSKTHLITQLVVYEAILEAIKAPESERESLEKYLQSLLAEK